MCQFMMSKKVSKDPPWATHFSADLEGISMHHIYDQNRHQSKAMFTVKVFILKTAK